MTSPLWIDLFIPIVMIPCWILIGLFIWFVLKTGE